MSKKVTTNSPKLFIGIDIHKRSWSIQASTDISYVESFTCPPDSEGLYDWVLSRYPKHEVSCAYEAGCCGFEAARDFMKYGWKVIVFNPSDITRKGRSAFQKTDKIDARLICRELRDNRLTCIEIPDRKREELRALFRHRTALVRDYRRIKTRIKMQLLYLGIEIPKEYDNSQWTHAFRDWIRSIEFYYKTGDQLFEGLMLQYDFIDEQIRKVSNELRAYCRSNYRRDYYLLKSIPGIGGIVACGIISELGDLRRFNSMKQLASYVGFIPYVKQSGESSFVMGMTPRAHHLMRSYFVEAAWQSIRKDPVMQAYYRSHAGKESKKIIVKVARKLLNRARAVLVTNTPYQTGVVA